MLAQKQLVERRIRGPQTKQERDDQALARMNSQIASAMTLSSLIGLGVGAVLGCVLGLAFLVVGCLPMASLGAIGGTLIGGGGGAFTAVQQYFNTINSPFRPQYY